MPSPWVPYTDTLYHSWDAGTQHSHVGCLVLLHTSQAKKEWSCLKGLAPYGVLTSPYLTAAVLRGFLPTEIRQR